MLQIEDTIISRDVLEQKFKCNLEKCKGNCCVYGDSGAPLEEDEAQILNDIYPIVKPYMRSEGIQAIQEFGTSMIDKDGDLVTPLIQKKECAYTQVKNGIYLCAIEAAFFDKKIRFRKPISCHLFPVRTKKFKDFTAVNYEKWNICRNAWELGKKEEIPVYKFLEESLVRKFGEKWFKKLSIAAKELYK